MTATTTDPVRVGHHRALVMESSGVMVLDTRPSRPPGNGEVAIEIAATGICGSDLHGLRGATGRRMPGQVMGHETSGVITEIGTDVDPSWMGRAVTVNPVMACGACSACISGDLQQCESSWVLGVRTDVDGAFAERVVVPLGNAQPLPPGMPITHAALVEPLSVGFHAARRGGAGAGDQVLVIGAGPIGQAVVLACRRLGVTSLLVSEPDRGRAHTAGRLGASVIAPDELSERLPEFLSGRPSLVFDAVGSDETLHTALQFSRRGSRIVLIGMASPRPTIDAYTLSGGERTIIGTYCYSSDDFRSTIVWLAQHPDVFDVVVDHTASLSDGPATFTALLAGQLAANKVLLQPDRPGLQAT